MSPNRRFSAVVLAAGHSTRMGRDKALLEADGVPLWRRQRDLVAAAGAAEVFLSARPEQPWVRDAVGFTAVLHDALQGCGPLVGITAALERAQEPWLAVVAIDLPRMTSGWFEQLFARCAPGVGAIGRLGERYEPLAAIYPQELKWLAWEAIGRGDYSLQRLAAHAVTQGLFRVREIDADCAPWFENWNEPREEWISPRQTAPGRPSS